MTCVPSDVRAHRATGLGRSSRLAVGLLLLGAAACVPRLGPLGPHRSDQEARIKWARRTLANEHAALDRRARAAWVLFLQANDLKAGEKLQPPKARQAGAELLLGPALKREVPPGSLRAEIALLRAETARLKLDRRAAGEAYLEALEAAPESLPGQVALQRLRYSFGEDRTLDTRIALVLHSLIAGDQLSASTRIAVWRLEEDLLNSEAEFEALRDHANGVRPSSFVIAGPFFRWPGLERDRRLALEIQSLQRGKRSYTPLETVQGPKVPREIRVGPGGLELARGASQGSGWLAMTDLLLKKSTTLWVSWEANREFILSLDGREVSRGSARDRERSFTGVQKLSLGAGRHRVALQVGGGRNHRFVALAFFGAEGRPQGFQFDTQGLSQPSVPSDAARPNESEQAAQPRFELHGTELHGALRMEAPKDKDDPVTWMWSAWQHQGQSPQWVRDRLPRYEKALGESAVFALLSGDLAQTDAARRGAETQAELGRQLQRSARVAPGIPGVWLRRFEFELSRDHQADARRALHQLERLAKGTSSTAAAQARYQLRHGFPAIAERTLEAGLRRSPSSCPLLLLALRTYAEEDALAKRDALAEQIRRCGPKGLDQWVQLQLEHGQSEAAATALRRLILGRPNTVRRVRSLAELEFSQGHKQEGLKRLREEMAMWPQDGRTRELLAELVGRLGHKGQAERLRREGLKLDPADLGLRRRLALGRGQELLAWGALDLEAEIKAYRSRQAWLRPASSAVEVVDHAAVEVVPTALGRPELITRIQSVTELLSKEGIDSAGELRLPPGAELITLYILKASGERVLPSFLQGDDAISLPGLEQGDLIVKDFVETADLPNRSESGWLADPFFFQTSNSAIYHSSYWLRVPESLDLEVDAHHFEADVVTRHEGMLEFRHEAHQVPPLTQERNGPSFRELVPWVQGGSGADVIELGRALGERLVGLDRPTPAMRRQVVAVQAALQAQGKLGLRALVLGLARWVDAWIKGAGSSGETAAQIFTSRQGSRLILLRALLGAAKLKSRVGFVRSYSLDPTPQAFPSFVRFSHSVLRVEIEAGRHLWIEPNHAGGPPDQLEESFLDQPALLVATPALEATLTRTPSGESLGPMQRIDATILLARDGSIQVEGSDNYFGHTAASMRWALGRYDEAARKKIVESMITSLVGPVKMKRIEFEHTGEGVPAGSASALRYAFEAEHWARHGTQGSEDSALAETLILPGDLIPLQIASVLLSEGSRTTPLLMGSPMRFGRRFVIKLPGGYRLQGKGSGSGGPKQSVVLETRFGCFKKSVTQQGSELRLEISLTVHRGRVAPADFPALVAFVQAVESADRSPILVSAKVLAQARVGSARVSP